MDGLIATGQDPVKTGRILVLAATEPRPPAGAKLCEEGLVRLGPPANEALLRELVEPHPTNRLRKLAALLTRTSKVRSPKPAAAWIGGDLDQRRNAVERWRDRIAEAGGLTLPPSAPPLEATSAPTHPSDHAPD
ncbi:MAG: hypothetical protein GY778_24945 [bacterium]|nr:hypothetical protein [bacterium]